MATLEKIRSKSVLLFTVIIVALLAFILGDFLTRGHQVLGTGDTVASADGVKVDYKTYQESVNQAVEAQRNQNQDGEALSQNVINNLLLEGLFVQEYDRMGIKVTDKELSMLINDPQAQMGLMQTLFQKLGNDVAQVLYSRGVRTGADFRAAIANPAKYGLQPQDAQALKAVWAEMEKDVDMSLRQQAYQTLLAGLFTANQVDAKAAYDDTNLRTTFSYVRKDLNAVPDKDAELAQEDYQAFYNEHKGAFKLDEESRVISYIYVPIAPSEKDYADGDAEVTEMMAQLSATEGLNALRSHKGFSSETGKYTRAQLAKDPQLRSITAGTDSTATLAVGNVMRTMAINGNYTIAKVLETGTGIDRVKLTFFGGQKTAVDSLLAKANAATFDSIATSRGGQTLELSLINPQQPLEEDLKEALANNPVGEIFTLTDTIAGEDGKKQVVSRAFRITERDAAAPYYEIAKINYVVVPSSETVTDLNNKFHAFVAKNANAKAFSENAEKDGYMVNQIIVSPSTPAIGGGRGIPNTRSAIKWAMDNKAGKVSNVINGNEYLLAVAVDEVLDGKYLPISSPYVQKMLRPQVTGLKKGNKLVADYAGKAKDLNGYAKLMGVPVAQAAEIFASNMIDGMQMPDLSLAGVVAGSPKGKVVGPFVGDNGVYVIVVDNVTKEGRPYEFAENADKFNNTVVRSAFSNPLKLLVGNKKVKNNILKFTADPE